MDAAFKEAVQRIAAQGQVEATAEQVVYFPPQPFAPALVSAVREAAQDQGMTWMNVISGAGHDAVYLARVCPAAMLFVRCAGGISHDPRESVEEADVAVALDVVERFLRGLA